MARTVGPLMSVDASGSFGKSMVFSKWKGRNYVRQLVTPTNYRYPAQTGVRSMMKFLAQYWASISAPNQATWEEAAETNQISAFNQYVKENLQRHQVNSPPTKDSPAAEASAGLTVSAHTYTGFAGYATLSMTPSAATAIWGFQIYRETAAITLPTWANTVAVIEADGANAVIYTDSPLEPATYHYRIRAINIDGKAGTILADDTAIVT